MKRKRSISPELLDEVHEPVRTAVLFAFVFDRVNDVRRQHQNHYGRAEEVDPSEFHCFYPADIVFIFIFIIRSTRVFFNCIPA
ncbi:MAG: hypothetical protein IJL25_05860 [Clostridia bacterium]|nr:hypothetical protein [Clostridia bacterium]